ARKIAIEEPIPPRRHDARIPLDLETICLKAMDKDPARRYASAAEMARDLERYLNREPILARPTGWPTRLTRWAQRRPAFASSVTLASLILVGGPVAFAIFAEQRASADRRAAAALAAEKQRTTVQRDLAKAEARRAQAATDFLCRMLGQAAQDSPETKD